MSKNNCCCGGGESGGFTFDSFCCEPYLFTDFITLYGDSMAEHAEVSPGDWIALKQTRLGAPNNSYWCTQNPQVNEACCCCMDECTGPGASSLTGFSNTVSDTSSHKFDTEVLNIFDKYNLNGNIVKKGKVKPKDKKNLFNNNFLKIKKYNVTKVDTKPENKYSPLLYNSKSAYSIFFDKIANQYGLAQNVQIGEKQNIVNKNLNNNVYNNFLDSSLFLGLTMSFVYGNTVTAQEAYDYSIEHFNKDIQFENLTSALCDCDEPRGGGDPTFCKQHCSCAHIENVFKNDFPPIYFAYKYSGCHFIWHPREFLFDKDPFITQCSSTKTYAGTECGAPGALKNAITNCGAFALTRRNQGWLMPEAYQCSEFIDGAAAAAIHPKGSPCHCAYFPHIHGGIKDALNGEFNVTQRPGQLGYVPSFRAFMDEMTSEEAGCCWCAGANAGRKIDIVDGKQYCRAKYPFVPGQGRIPRFFDICGPGLGCHFVPEQPGHADDWVAGNPNYTQSCFHWGISPYLIRIAKDKFKAGHEIFVHGDITNPFKKYNFGADFTLSSIEINPFTRDIDINLKKQLFYSSSLKDQCIGFVQLEHHFECCAFRSPAGAITNDPGIIVNSGANMYETFEADAYPGVFKAVGGPTCAGGQRATFRISQYGAHVWQIKRGVPRRVMYAGSGIPVFKFDLIMMENWSKKNSTSTIFDSTLFLEHWFRYFYGLLSFSADIECRQCNVAPEPLEWDYSIYQDSYTYVTYWLKQMVVAGILRIKDHAIDISKEVNDLIGSAAYIQDPDDPTSEILSVPERTINECGSVAEFVNLVNFFQDTYPEVEPGTKNVTPKMVKEKLLNPSGLSTNIGPGGESVTMRAFLPRRARLPSGFGDTRVYGWGCTGASPITQISGCTTCQGAPVPGISCCLPGITCPSYVDDATYIPGILNTTNTELLAEIAPIKVVSGLSNTAVIDRNGKLIIFGGTPANSDFDTGQPCGTLITYAPDGTEITYLCSFDMHPSQVGSIPWYLDQIWAVKEDPLTGEFTLKDYNELPDGHVKDIALNPYFAVALIDSYRRGLGSFCGSLAPAPDYKPSFEYPEYSPAYQAMNTNGTNVTIQYFQNPDADFQLRCCVLDEPWCTVLGGEFGGLGNPDDGTAPQDNYFGARTSYSESAKVATYRLKSWGSKGKTMGTFSLSKQDARIHNLGFGRAFIPSCGGTDEIAAERLANCTCYDFNNSNTATLAQSFENGYRGYDPEINPDNLRYPGTNTWFIWTKIACGLKHFAALDDFGGVFITAFSSNEDGQSEKGKPLPYFSLQKSESWPQQGFSDPQYHYPDYSGFESRFNYFNHIPRPGFISKDNWSQDLYNSLTSRFSPWANCNGACIQTAVVEGVGINGCYRINSFAGRGMTAFCLDQPLSGGGFTPPTCHIPIRLPQNNCEVNWAGERYWDLSTFFMGSLSQRPPKAFSTTPDDVISLCKPRLNVEQQPDNIFQPRYTNLACGTYNTMLLTNENRIELYGKYYQIDEAGNKVGPIINGQIKGITCFVPDIVLNLQGQWGLTYACSAYCPPLTYQVNGVDCKVFAGVTHYPILGANYNYPTQKNTFNIIKSSADYSIAATKGGRIFVWGDASMVPGAYNIETYVPGKTGAAEINLIELDNLPSNINIENIIIKDIAVGINSFYIHYKIDLANSEAAFFRTACYSRYGRKDFGAELPEEIKNSELTSISAGNGFAIAIAGSGSVPLTWNYDLFNNEHKKYQYKNFNNLPLYFRRDAYFHAIPGNWDFSKWLWGAQSCSSLARFWPQHPASKPDRCSALAYNIYRDSDGNPLNPAIKDDDPRRFTIEKSYSGHPELIWHRPDLRRTVYDSFNPISDTRERQSDGTILGNSICNGYFDQAQPVIGGAGSIDFGYCTERLGSCWSSSHPASPLYSIRNKRTVDTCNYATIDCPKPKKKGVCPYAYVCLGADAPHATSYGSSRDIFQFKVAEWKSVGYASGDACAQWGQYRLNYFKYSQRNFYFGYDKDKDTWNIYPSPDILRDTAKTEGIETDLCCHINTSAIVCPDPDPDKWICPGITFITSGGASGWGGGISGSWPSLSSYPMVGPNYARQDIDSLPIHIPSSKMIGLAFFYAGFSSPEGNGNECTISPCANGEGPAVYEGLGGPGVLAFKSSRPISCGVTDPDTGVETAPNIPANNAIYYHNPITLRYDKPSTMLYGVKNEINPNIPPSEDPNYIQKGFKQVLLDPSLTVIDQPWTTGNIEYKPIIIKTGFPGKVLIENHGLTAGSVIMFEENPADVSFGNILKVRIQTTDGSIKYLRIETAYFVSTEHFSKDEFAICENINRLDRPLNLTVQSSTTHGLTSYGGYDSNRWYQMFDVHQSYFQGIFSEDGYRKTPKFISGPTACYVGTNPPILAGNYFVEVVLIEVDGIQVIDKIIGNSIDSSQCCAC